MFKYLNNLILLSILMLSLSCKKKCETINEAPEDFLNYWFFPNNSWWVYQRMDTTAVIYDTAFATKYEERLVGDTKCMWHYRIQRYHTYADEFDQWISDGTYGSKRFLKIVLTKNATTFNFDIIYPFELGDDPIGIIDYTISEISILNTPAGNFESILHLDINIDRKSIKTDLFLAPEVGVIKTIEPDSSVWELVDYHIEEE